MRSKIHLFFLLMLTSSLYLFANDSFILQLEDEIPLWMKEQIQQDYYFFYDKSISLEKMDSFFYQNSASLLLVKFTIHNNQIMIDIGKNDLKTLNLETRLNAFLNSLSYLSQITSLPDISFLISLHDGLSEFNIDLEIIDIPILVMSKLIRPKKDPLVLIPDFEALQAKYQILKDKDITQFQYPWEMKKNQLVWRGSTAQYSWKDFSNIFIDQNNFQYFSRVNLCMLSEKYPEIIDAGFTHYAQNGENIPYLKKFKKSYLPFEEQMQYKYHILIDGNSCAYSNSGWKFFTNSLIFKPDSRWVQWYYGALKPYVHYIPVSENLNNLVLQIVWAENHDLVARNIASNAYKFAQTHLTLKHHLTYFYHLLHTYHQLNFVE